MLDIGLKFYAVPSQCPHPLNDLEVKVTDIDFCEMKCLYHISQSSESIHISNKVCFQIINTDPGCMSCGGSGGKNIEHPQTIVSLSCFIWQIHLNFIDKAQFR